MKKILSAFAALGISLLSVVPAVSSAYDEWDMRQSSNLEDFISDWVYKDYLPLDEKYYPLFDCHHYEYAPKDQTLYIRADGNRIISIYPSDYEEEAVTLADGVSVDQANALLKERFPNLGDNPPHLTEKETLSDGTVSYEMICHIDGFDKAASIYLEENGMIDSFITKTGFYELISFDCRNIMNFDSFYSASANHYISKKYDMARYANILDYVEQNNLGTLCYEDIERWNGIEHKEHIEFYDNVTLTERLDTVLEINQRYGVVPETTSDIDIYDALKGDANVDGVVDIADAARILQAIGNPDKYGLTPQGEYNVDVNCSGGVTALDALEVQRLDVERE